MKRTWFTTLTLLCAAAFVQADGMPSTPADTGAETASADMKAPAKSAYKAKAKRLPRGDLRHCLEMSTNEEIIRCAETRRKR